MKKLILSFLFLATCLTTFASNEVIFTNNNTSKIVNGSFNKTTIYTSNGLTYNVVETAITCSVTVSGTTSSGGTWSFTSTASTCTKALENAAAVVKLFQL